MRVLFCGLGGIGQRHLRNLRTLLGDRLEVHAFRVRRNRDRLLDNLTVADGADVESDFAIAVHHDLRTALSAKPAVVFVCNPSSLHISIALAAAEAGSHLFIEKPVSHDMDRVDNLLSIVRQKSLVCLVGYNFRFHPGPIRLKEMVDAGVFGRIIGVQAEIGEYLPNWHRYEDYRQMYAARQELGGGVILSQIHEMDLICWLFGIPKRILCMGGHLSGLDVDVEDSATSLMQSDGPHGRFPIVLHQDFVQRPPARTFKVVGDAGIARLDLIANRLTTYGAGGEAVIDDAFPGFSRNDMFMDQARHLLDCIQVGTPPKVDLPTGILSLRLALAAKESLGSGKTVELHGGD